jgi:3-oxoacyl-[acyl-carrier protein] reductase
MDLQLKNKIALVTGSNRGTGEIIATTLSGEGAIVIGHANIDTADRPESDLAHHVWGDIATEPGRQQVLEQLKELDLSVDILINNYGTADRHKWNDSDHDKWLQMYEVNVLSAARLIQALFGPMKEKGWGRIINLGTIGSHQPNNVMPAYYAAKGALATMGVSLAKELAGTGVTVNTVSPGLIRTAEVEAAMNAGKLSANFLGPTGRPAEREEVADLVAFIASPRADYINGQNLRIDGGLVCYV